MCVNDIAYWGGHTRIVLVGDSRMRQLFCALAAYADDDSQVGSSGTACPSSVRHLRGVGAEAPQAGVTGGPKASEGRGWPAEDLEYTSDKNQLRIEFRSRPTLDRLVQKEVSRFEDESVSERPTLVVLASGLAALLSPNASAAYSVHDTKLATELRENVTSLVHLVDRLPRTRAFWMLQGTSYAYAFMLCSLLSVPFASCYLLNVTIQPRRNANFGPKRFAKYLLLPWTPSKRIVWS